MSKCKNHPDREPKCICLPLCSECRGNHPDDCYCLGLIKNTKPELNIIPVEENNAPLEPSVSKFNNKLITAIDDEIIRALEETNKPVEPQITHIEPIQSDMQEEIKKMSIPSPIVKLVSHLEHQIVSLKLENEVNMLKMKYKMNEEKDTLLHTLTQRLAQLDFNVPSLKREPIIPIPTTTVVEQPIPEPQPLEEPIKIQPREDNLIDINIKDVIKPPKLPPRPKKKANTLKKKKLEESRKSWERLTGTPLKSTKKSKQ